MKQENNFSNRKQKQLNNSTETSSTKTILKCPVSYRVLSATAEKEGTEMREKPSIMNLNIEDIVKEEDNEDDQKI